MFQARCEGVTVKKTERVCSNGTFDLVAHSGKKKIYYDKQIILYCNKGHNKLFSEEQNSDQNFCLEGAGSNKSGKTFLRKYCFL